MKLTFLGTGTSNGLPVIGCDCPVCRSDDPRDKRMRTSAVVHSGDTALLIDTAPELRLQALAVGLKRIDAVLYTHAHADHVDGFDDLRRFNQINQARLDMYCDAETARMITSRYQYAFEYPFPFFGGKPDLNVHVFDGDFMAAGVPVQPFQVGHGRWTVNGFRMNRLVYLTDAKEIPEESIEVMRDADVLVINALRDEPHPVHLSLAQALEVIREVAPKRAYLVHLSHELPHAATSRRLPDNVFLAYDGLTVEV
jgi:phosphoribosyl 1,2-cyclic phosphate phosphodiesterase